MQIEKCAICGKLGAILYVCENCKRRVCEECFETNAGFCTDCYKRLKSEAPMLKTTSILMKVFLLGFVLVFIGILIMVVASLYGTATTSWGLIFIIGFIPIILGAGPYSILAILLATILTIIGLIIFFMMRKRA